MEAVPSMYISPDKLTDPVKAVAPLTSRDPVNAVDPDKSKEAVRRVYPNPFWILSFSTCNN
jgi:hypothetical protein